MATVPRSPRPRRMTREDRNRQLLEVAEAVFAERGISAASMEEIGERAGITKPVLYDHFGSKDGLLAALIERNGAELGAEVEAAVAGAADPADAVARGLHAYFTFIAAHRAAWLSLLSETTSHGAGGLALEKVRNDRAMFMASLIVAEVPDAGMERAVTYAQAVIGACERLATFSSTEQALSPKELSASLMDVVWLGFDRVRRGESWTA